MTPLKEIVENIEKEFDAQFPEDSAGCDGCDMSIRKQNNIKSFLRSYLPKAIEARDKEILAEIEKSMSSMNTMQLTENVAYYSLLSIAEFIKSNNN
jgi:hypothetical protein